jgi:cytochrome P450
MDCAVQFGSGYMTCPGRHLGKMEMSKLLTTMFLEWDIELEKPTEPWKIRGTILVKGQDWRVKIRPRKKAPMAPAEAVAH